jgi:hypothetical protein
VTLQPLNYSFLCDYNINQYSEKYSLRNVTPIYNTEFMKDRVSDLCGFALGSD